MLTTASDRDLNFDCVSKREQNERACQNGRWQDHSRCIDGPAASILQGLSVSNTDRHAPIDP